MSPQAIKVARQRFKYIYTGLRGDNAQGVSPWAIRRDSCAPRDHPSFIRACLEGGADKLYMKNIEKYENMGSEEADRNI